MEFFLIEYYEYVFIRLLPHQIVRSKDLSHSPSWNSSCSLVESPPSFPSGPAGEKEELSLINSIYEPPFFKPPTPL